MKKLSLFLLAMLCCVSTDLRASELTIAEGTDWNGYIPFSSGSVTNYQRMQFIYDKDSLVAMSGSSIYQMTFYTSSEIATNWGDALFKVALAEVTETDFGTVDADAAFITADTTKVYSGQFSVYGNELVIEFKDPFAYKGGNLLLEVDLFLIGTDVSTWFYGTNTEAEGPIHGVIGTNYFSSDITTVNSAKSGKHRFIPKTTFSYGTKSSCTKPTGLIAYNVTNNSAKIGWTTEPDVTYTLEYKKMGSYYKWTTIEDASIVTATLSGLSEYTTYLVRLKKNCGEEGVSAYATTSFFTPCAPLSGDLPYIYDFEDVYINEIPTCWYKIANGNYPGVQSNAEKAHEGNKFLYFSGGTKVTQCVAILPTFSTPYSNLAISFWYKVANAGDDFGKAQIGYMTNRSDASSFVSIEDLPKVTEYTLAKDIALGSIPSDAYLAIRIGEATYSNQLYIDSLVISSATPTCSKPTGLTIGSIAHNGATVTWDKGSATTSVLQFKRSDAVEWTTVNNATSPYALTGLEATTSYDVHVKNSCDGIGESDYCATSTFTTPCAPFEADSEHPFSEGFESGIPACWDKSERYGYVTLWNVTTTHHTGDQGVYCMYDFTSKGEYAVIRTSPIYINSTAKLTFWYKNTGTGTLSVYYAIDGGDRVLLLDNLGNADAWTDRSVDLPTACNKHIIQLYFKGTSDGNDGFFYLDDILVECAETCPKPKNLATAVTGNSVAVTWTAGGSESEWQYICQPTADPVDWNGSAVKTATSAPVELADLNPATNYTFYLRAKCAADDLSAVVSKEFKTGCAASISSLICGFEESEGYTSGELPECWNMLYKTEPATKPAVTTTDAEYGDQHLRITGSTWPQVVVLPKFSQEVKNMQISFKYKRTIGASLYLASMNNPEDISNAKSFGGPFSTGTTYNAVEEFQMTDARAGDYYLAFYYYVSSGTPTLYIDDIVVEPIPTCKAPIDLIVSTPATANSVGLSWTEKGTASAWLIQVSTDGGANWDEGTAADSNPFLLSGLTSSTPYKARVKAVCSELDSSKWSNIIDFTTEEDTSTALNNTSAEAAATKLIRNGQVLINRNGVLYTLTGQEVK